MSEQAAVKIKLFAKDGSKSQETSVEHFPVFTDERGTDALRQVVNALMAARRQGNACAKNRSEVSGSGKKPWRQKGTGHARHGSRRSPIWVGGGVTHGPRPRDYSQKLNKSMKRLALARAIYNKYQEGAIDLIESFEFNAPKTKDFVAVVGKIYPEPCKLLLVDANFDDNTVLSSRNVAGVELSEASSLNVLDLVRSRKVLMTPEALELLIRRVGA